VYGSNGVVVDPETHTTLDGFAVNNAETHGAYAVLDEENGRIIFLEAGAPPWTANLHAFDLESRPSIRSLAVPAAPGPGDATSLIRWGTDGLAFRGGSRVFVIRTSLVRR
jgi:hypothetical protein